MVIPLPKSSPVVSSSPGAAVRNWTLVALPPLIMVDVARASKTIAAAAIRNRAATAISMVVSRTFPIAVVTVVVVVLVVLTSLSSITSLVTILLLLLLVVVIRYGGGVLLRVVRPSAAHPGSCKAV